LYKKSRNYSNRWNEENINK